MAGRRTTQAQDDLSAVNVFRDWRGRTIISCGSGFMQAREAESWRRILRDGKDPRDLRRVPPAEAGSEDPD